jgi:hypothetical protein
MMPPRVDDPAVSRSTGDCIDLLVDWMNAYR